MKVNRGQRLVPTNQNYLETSLISFPNARWRVFKNTGLFKIKAHSKAAIQNDHGGMLSQAEKHGAMEISFYVQWELCYIFSIFPLHFMLHSYTLEYVKVPNH